MKTRTVVAAAYSAEIVSMGLLEPLGTAENVLLFEHDTEHTSGIRTQNAKLQSLQATRKNRSTDFCSVLRSKSPKFRSIIIETSLRVDV